MPRTELLAFAGTHKLAVLSTIAPGGALQGTGAGIAVTLGRDAEILQLEVIAGELNGAALEPYQKLYFSVWSDGPDRLDWPGITYFKVTPRWMRYSDFRCTSPRVVELKLQ
ncbi:MAG: hypothetical protein K2P94_06765 [Rhodospirillaceae bacterium]|nr:hypothetical protein [Rhodospirillaceae bacterium]